MIFYIDSLNIRNFKGLGALDFTFADNRPVVFIGENGAGKTSLLAAINIALRQFTSRIQNPKAFGRVLDDTYIRNGESSVEISIELNTDRNRFGWRISRSKIEPQQRRDRDVIGLKEALESYSQLGGDRPLPLIAYYPTNRAVLEIPLKIKTQLEFHPADAYETSIKDLGLNFRQFFEWFRMREDLENELIRDDPSTIDLQLKAVRGAMQAFDPAYSGLRVRRNPLRLVVIKKNTTQQSELSFDQLSDGEKCAIALIGDIARRLAISDPSSSRPLENAGVVLIDEIELHLHPSWQRRIVPLLSLVFPNCQFFITTHSPQALSEIQRAYVFNLAATDHGAVVETVGKWYGKDSNRILEDLMGVDERPNKVKEEIRLLFRQIDDGDLAAARRSLQVISEQIGSDDPSYARASVLIRKKEVLGR